MTPPRSRAPAHCSPRNARAQRRPARSPVELAQGDSGGVRLDAF